MVGVIEEQHPKRARLFMQWKGMEWPLLVDSLNLLEVPFVPITLLVDEDGKARRAPRLRTREEIEEVVRAFVSEGNETGENGSKGESAEAGPETSPGAQPTRSLPTRSLPTRSLPTQSLPTRSVDVPLRPASQDATGWRQYGRRLFLNRGLAGLDTAIAAYRRALAREAEDPDEDSGGWGHFRLGVLLRARYDSPHRREGDFQAAVDHWRTALERDPNNYIFRRRIQQYGPRLDKPYPFYDWVATARREIRARGEDPVELTVLPGGAEIAQPARQGEKKRQETTAATAPAQPDPEGRILRDAGDLVQVETTVVPGTRAPEDGTAAAMQIHLAFRPDDELKVHWNNEAEGLTVWLEPVAGLEIEPRRVTVPNPSQTLSRETRRVELGVERTEPPPSPPEEDGAVRIPGYALYYVCEDIDGTCLYRRQDLAVEVPLAPSGGR